MPRNNEDSKVSLLIESVDLLTYILTIGTCLPSTTAKDHTLMCEEFEVVWQELDPMKRAVSLSSLMPT